MDAIDTLFRWYNSKSRDLPWRGIRDPYKIWISEIILQQTRVNQGLPYYRRFIEKFPDIQSLANAPEQEVLRIWQGLGYYSRARNLHKAARIIVTELDHFPQTFEQLVKLPGIGPYTAAAIASFAFLEPVAAVDGNAIRVYTRIFEIGGDITRTSTLNAIRDQGGQLISKEQPDTYNQAIMELGSQICTPLKPACGDCPLASICLAFKHKTQGDFPARKGKPTVRDRYFNYFVILMGDHIGMRKRNDRDIWRGLFDFYLIESDQLVQRPDEVKDPFVRDWLTSGAEIGEVIDTHHMLSHQRLITRFFEVLAPVSQVSEPYPDQNHGIHFYSKKETLDLPKPKPVEHLLQDLFERHNI